MLSLSVARQLKEAGLLWEPALHDFFAVPDRGLDERVFVIADMMATHAMLRGQPALLFNGAVEWALDYIMIVEVVWIPTESQVRAALEQRLLGIPDSSLSLISTLDGYRCEIHVAGETHTFEAFGAPEAYGLALLHLLERP
jgi:hypothetical protein